MVQAIQIVVLVVKKSQTRGVRRCSEVRRSSILPLGEQGADLQLGATVTTVFRSSQLLNECGCQTFLRGNKEATEECSTATNRG